VEVIKTGETDVIVGDTVHYHFVITNTGSSDSPNLAVVSIVDDVLGDLSGPAPAACDNLAVGASCDFDVNRVALEADVPSLTNTVTVHYNPVGFPNDITDFDSHTVNVAEPPLATVTIIKTTLGGTDSAFSFTSNLPERPGSNPAGEFTLDTTGGIPAHTDSIDFAEVDPATYHATEEGETGWNLVSIDCSSSTGTSNIVTNLGTKTATFTVAADGHATCVFTNEPIPEGVTRTQGYWQTHLTQVRTLLDTGDGPDNYEISDDNDFIVGGSTHGKKIDDLPTLFAAFYSSIPYDSSTCDDDDCKRSSLNKAKMQMSQQLMAAMLNCRAFDSNPGSHGGLPILHPDTCDAPVGTAAGNAINGVNRNDVLTLHGLLGAFNESGDDQDFPDGFENSRALAKDAKAIAKDTAEDTDDYDAASDPYNDNLTGIEGYDDIFWDLVGFQPFDI
jgi:hypothetical protein